MAALALAVATPAAAQDDETIEAEARETLRRARLYFDRGEFDRAVDAFDSILVRPVKLRTADDLHEAFLYYAFTLFLQGKEEQAVPRLLIALEIDPEFVPSPVTTRPDLKAFYDEQRERYKQQTEGTSPRLLEQIFPELARQVGGGRVVIRRAFVPVLGIGLMELGHRRAGGFLMATELTALSVNIASLVMREAVRKDRTPTGWTVTYVSRGLNYPSFAVWWTAIAIDLVVSLALRAYYQKHPERMPEAPRRRGRAKPPPKVTVSPAGLRLAFW